MPLEVQIHSAPFSRTANVCSSSRTVGLLMPVSAEQGALEAGRVIKREQILFRQKMWHVWAHVYIWSHHFRLQSTPLHVQRSWICVFCVTIYKLCLHSFKQLNTIDPWEVTWTWTSGKSAWLWTLMYAVCISGMLVGTEERKNQDEQQHKTEQVIHWNRDPSYPSFAWRHAPTWFLCHAALDYPVMHKW